VRNNRIEPSTDPRADEEPIQQKTEYAAAVALYFMSTTSGGFHQTLRDARNGG
jgi:hypothetical protein